MGCATNGAKGIPWRGGRGCTTTLACMEIPKRIMIYIFDLYFYKNKQTQRKRNRRRERGGVGSGDDNGGNAVHPDQNKA